MSRRDSVFDVLWRESGSAMLVVDSERRIREANPASAAILGRFRLGVGDQMVQTYTTILGPDGKTRIPIEQVPITRALGGETFNNQPLTVQLVEGEEPRRLLMSGRPVRLDDGMDGALLSWNDITESWQLTEQAGRQMEDLSGVLESATDHAIIRLDAYGRVQTWSRTAARLHGYPAQEVIGMPYATLFDDGDRASGVPEKILTTAVASGRTVAEGKRVRRDGSVFWARATVTAIRGDNGQLGGFFKVTQDVSGQRATERIVVQLNAELQEVNSGLEQRVAERTAQLQTQATELVSVNSELEAFSYSVSHDLRAPLRAMSGYARILEEDHAPALGDEGMRLVGRVQENAVQMGNLVDALLSFSRLQRQTLTAQPLNMAELVRTSWELLAPVRAGRSVRFGLDDLPPAIGDPRLIQQVWTNLLDNAVKYSSQVEHARIEVFAHPHEQDGVWFGVRDNGIGFDMRYVCKLGQVFQRLHRPEDFAGTGIGLALVQRIVNRHGGRLTAEGEPGVGATIGFTLKGTA